MKMTKSRSLVMMKSMYDNRSIKAMDVANCSFSCSHCSMELSVCLVEAGAAGKDSMFMK